ncbi:GlxA family transcriptional regulator [Streptomyces sp. NBC_01497]|uniref:GlxA family transcriptional regulator n=1 Tax=Streptomyces sp. NBC_01497 TaxID=2903885 RepID=UPI002E359663|nr:DJ-1/PfpI family protein [Streptomyces sp. NBC_01497]
MNQPTISHPATGPRPGGAPRPLTVTVLVFPGVRLLDVTAPIEVFSAANQFGADYRVRTVSADGADITTRAGLRLPVDLPAAEADGTSDVLVVPGSSEWDPLIKDEALLATVRSLDAQASRTAAICAGAFLLAAAGLLDGCRAATHWRFADELASRFPGVAVDADAIFVRDGRVMTSAGGSSGIDLSLALVEEHWGADVARSVAKDLVVFMQRPGGQSQFSVRSRQPHSRQSVLRHVLDAVAEDPAGDHTVTALARRAGTSVRHLGRLFSGELGTTPARYVEQVRVEAARTLLEAGDDPMTAVAHRTGLGSPESLRRAFVRNLGVTPGAFRASFRTTGTGGGARPASQVPPGSATAGKRVPSPAARPLSAPATGQGSAQRAGAVLDAR